MAITRREFLKKSVVAVPCALAAPVLLAQPQKNLLSIKPTELLIHPENLDASFAKVLHPQYSQAYLAVFKDMADARERTAARIFNKAWSAGV